MNYENCDPRPNFTANDLDLFYNKVKFGLVLLLGEHVFESFVKVNVLKLATNWKRSKEFLLT